MPTGRRMNKKVAVHIHNGILLSYWKECIWISSNEVDETGAYYTELSQKRKTPIQYINTHMQFRKIVTATLHVRQQKRHRYKEQTFGLCGRRRGWDDLQEQHWNMYITICETDDQSKLNAGNRALKARALGQPRGMGCGEGWVWHGGYMYTCGWFTSMYGKSHHSIVQ